MWKRINIKEGRIGERGREHPDTCTRLIGRRVKAWKSRKYRIKQREKIQRALQYLWTSVECNSLRMAWAKNATGSFRLWNHSIVISSYNGTMEWDSKRNVNHSIIHHVQLLFRTGHQMGSNSNWSTAVTKTRMYAHHAGYGVWTRGRCHAVVTTLHYISFQLRNWVVISFFLSSLFIPIAFRDNTRIVLYIIAIKLHVTFPSNSPSAMNELAVRIRNVINTIKRFSTAEQVTIHNSRGNMMSWRERQPLFFVSFFTLFVAFWMKLRTQRPRNRDVQRTERLHAWKWKDELM